MSAASFSRCCYLAVLVTQTIGFEAGRAEEVAQSDSVPVQKSETASNVQPPTKELFTGKVVLLREALKRRNIDVGKEMAGQAVLETPTGELIPIAADWRGRAFFQDARLRNRKVELVGFRRSGVPYLQVLIVYTFDKKGKRFETDYWCDTCAIPLYELKECECCQEPVRLRFRPGRLPEFLQTPQHGQNDKSRGHD